MPDALLADQVKDKVEALPEPLQAEVLHFVEFLHARTAGGDRRAWSGLSLGSAMRGMEDEDGGYSESDLTERFS